MATGKVLRPLNSTVNSLIDKLSGTRKYTAVISNVTEIQGNYSSIEFSLGGVSYNTYEVCWYTDAGHRWSVELQGAGTVLVPLIFTNTSTGGTISCGDMQIQTSGGKVTILNRSDRKIFIHRFYGINYN